MPWSRFHRASTTRKTLSGTPISRSSFSKKSAKRHSRPWAANTIPRRFCSGIVEISDGRKHAIHYSIAEDTGIIGATWGVEWCVVGLDRNWAVQSGLPDGQAIGGHGVPRNNTRLPSQHSSREDRVYSLFVLVMFQTLMLLTSRQSARRSQGCCDASEHPIGWPLPRPFSLLRISPLRRRTAGRGGPASSTFMCWRCPGRPRSATRPANADAAAGSVRGAAVLVRGAWPVAAIRARLPGIVPGAGAAARPQHRELHARPDAVAANALHQWDKHGTCWGSTRAPISTTCARLARMVKIPEAYIELRAC